MLYSTENSINNGEQGSVVWGSNLLNLATDLGDGLNQTYCSFSTTSKAVAGFLHKALCLKGSLF